MNMEKKILIVDDEEKARLYLASILHELFPEFLIQFASSPQEAIFLLECQYFDIILLDVEMPGMTGLEMLEQLRIKIKNTLTIFISAYKRAEFIQKAMRLNALDYIDKPVDPEELYNAINKCLHFANNNSGETSQVNKKLNLFTERGEMFFKPDEILYFESLKRDAIALFANGAKSVIVRHNLSHLEQHVLSNEFLRISRQHIINIKYLKFISKSNRSITLSTGNHNN